MRLIAKLTIWYIFITAIVLAIGGNMVFNEVMHNVDHEAHRKLGSWIYTTEVQLRNGTPIDQLDINSSIKVEELDYGKPEIPLFKKDTTAVFAPRKRGDDRKMSYGKSFKTNGHHYFILAENFVAEPDEIAEGVEKSLLTIAFLIVLIVGILSIVISRFILEPFNKSLAAMDSFNIKDQTPLLFSKAGTKEFNSLNQFLEKMTMKAVGDYNTLKEFSENASHEIQTPLAVIRGKMELLSETDINEQQADFISAIQNSVNKLSSVNNSLILLTKLENQEYDVNEFTDFSDLLNKTIVAFQELMDMKNLAVVSEIESNVNIRINSYLADVLLNNLIKNSIRHNKSQGRIFITLTSSHLIIKNDGDAPEVPTEQLFQRFKKGKQSTESTGLGLSIVKKICDLNGLRIHYTYADSLHTVEILF